MAFPMLRSLWKCNDKLAELNYFRFQEMDLERNLTPAVLTYEGLQYQHMAPEVFYRGSSYIYSEKIYESFRGSMEF